MLTQRERKRSQKQQPNRLNSLRSRSTLQQRLIEQQTKKAKTLTKSTKSWVKVLITRRLWKIDRSKVRMHRGCKRNHLISIWPRWHKSANVDHLKSSHRSHQSKARRQRRKTGLLLTKSQWSTSISSFRTPPSSIRSSWMTSRSELSTVLSKVIV